MYYLIINYLKKSQDIHYKTIGLWTSVEHISRSAQTLSLFSVLHHIDVIYNSAEVLARQ